MEALGDYTVGQTIGRGEFATVRLGEHASEGYKVAMKFLDKMRIMREGLSLKVENEISNHRVLSHKHVIAVKDVVETDRDVCFVQEYAPGGDLFDYIVRHIRLKDDEAKRLFGQLIDGIGYCHEQGVVHRDIKPENILMDADFNIKIADFGLSSRWHKGEFLTDSCGSPNYAAPELLSKPPIHYEGPEVDVWSCGVVLYTLLCGELPFDHDSIPALFKKIRNGIYTIPGYVSPDAKDLLIKILTVDPALRITLDEIRQHPWLQDDADASATEPALPSAVAVVEGTPVADPAVPAAAVASEPTAHVANTEPAADVADKRCSAGYTFPQQLPSAPMRTGSGDLLRQYSRSLPKSGSCPYGRVCDGLVSLVPSVRACAA